MNTNPSVIFYTDFNPFSLYLIKIFLDNFFQVRVFTNKPQKWQKEAKNLIKTSALSVYSTENKNNLGPANYCIFYFSRSERNIALAKFRSIYLEKKLDNIKTLVIFTGFNFKAAGIERVSPNDNLAFIYIPHLIVTPERIQESGRFGDVLKEAITLKTMTVGVGEVFYPILYTKAADKIYRLMLSFGLYGKKTILLGSHLSATDLWKILISLIPDLKIYYDATVDIVPLLRFDSRLYLKTNPKLLISQMLKETQPTNFIDIAGWLDKFRFIFRLKRAFTYLAIIFLFPLFCLIISGIMFYLSYRIYLSNNSQMAKKMLLLSRVPVVTGQFSAQILEKVFFISPLYKNFSHIFSTGREGINLFIVAIDAGQITKDFFGKVLGDEIYDPENYARSLGPILQYIYHSANLLENKIKLINLTGLTGSLFPLNKSIDFQEIKSIALLGDNILREVTDILGKSKRVTYLVLLQNNMELRPTGGFIGSFAIITFEGGRLTDFSVSDVYSADGQLKGHVEPPAPIRVYLGEANWYLRDSNWDPDFPTSAKRAEWFIDKEIGKKVDGVIAIDLSPVKDTLSVIGPIYLTDYDMDITADNLYEKTQAEVHKNFFPGSLKKASFLTALARKIALQLSDLDDRQKLAILKLIYKNIKSRHIQFYFHNNRVQSSISDLGWSGSLIRNNCGGDCYADFVALVEANVGVNKANYFVTRDQKLEINISDNWIRRNLTINFKNTANPALGLPANYKSYVRVLVPADSVIEGNFEVSDVRGLKEIGFLVEVIAGQEKSVSLSWSSPSEMPKYGILVRKQAGVDESGKLSVVINGELQYNSPLVTDTWIQKP